MTITGFDNLSGTGLGGDTLSGVAGYLVLAGWGGADSLSGGGGADTLLGGDGADTLVGQSGADVSTGGAGADVFQYESVYDIGSNSERITDFSHAQGDRIDLHLIDADTLVEGDQAFVFIGSEFFHRTAGELRTYAYAGDYLVQGDVDGDGTADFTLRVNAPLVSGDFIF